VRVAATAAVPVVEPSRLPRVFNFSGSEIVFLLLLALIILGPEKLPEAIRKFGQTYAEFKKVTTGFQTELKQALDEPMREMRETADLFKQASTFEVMNPFEAAASAASKLVSPTPDAAASDASPTPVEAVHVEASAAEPSGAEPPRAPAAKLTPAEIAAQRDAAPAFESTIISGGSSRPAAVEPEQPVETVEPGEPVEPGDAAEPASRPAGPAFHSAAPPRHAAPVTEVVAAEPTEAPTEAPIEAPIEAPTDAAIEAPTDAAIEAPTDAAIAAPDAAANDVATDDAGATEPVGPDDDGQESISA
jgi:sec-independent protein translocase protein TatB